MNGLPSPTPDTNELLEYIRERDAKRRDRWIVGFIIAGVLGVGGWTAHNYMESQRETDRLEQERVEMFRDALND